MGKTGTTIWVQVKGAKGQIRLVPKAEGELKRPGPNQRFRAGATVKMLEPPEGEGRFGGRSGGRGGRGRGRGGSRGGTPEPTASPVIRKAMRRAKVSILGAKSSKSK
ncbi:MAG: DUF5350 domain-containing protein [Methanoregulaceae archaeon]